MTTKLTQAELKALLHYNPATGVFTRVVRTSKRIRVGQVAGTSFPSDYVRIRLKSARFLAHRLAWLYMTGAAPPQQVDHINGDRRDNRWSNLRLADRALNTQNQRKPRSDNTTGYLGVVRSGNGKFTARLSVGGRVFTGPRRDRAEIAYVDYVTLKREHHAGGTL